MRRILFLLAILLSISPVLADTRLFLTDASYDTNQLIQNGCSIIHELEEGLAVSCPDEFVKSAGLSDKVENYFLIEAFSENSLCFLDDKFKIEDVDYAKFLNADKVWDLGITGNGSIVAIIDTGVDYTHPELNSSYLGGKDFVNGDNDPMDDQGHGTHVAGIITADGINPTAKGIAPNAKIIAAKVCSSFGFCWESDLIAGIDWAMKGLDGIVNSGDEPDAISISLGSSNRWVLSNCDSQAVAKKVNEAFSKGINVVIAAGNYPFGVSSPACSSKAIAVGATSSSSLASFSGRGFSMKDHGVVAPGVSVFSTVPKGSCALCDSSGYLRLSGTSMSTPHVSGLIALMKEKNDGLSVSFVKSTIFKSTRDMTSGVVSEDKRLEIGFGLIDAKKTIDNTPPSSSQSSTTTTTNAFLTWSQCLAFCYDGIPKNIPQQCFDKYPIDKVIKKGICPGE